MPFWNCPVWALMGRPLATDGQNLKERAVPSQSRELQEDQGRLIQWRPCESGVNMGSVVLTVAEREFLGQVTSGLVFRMPQASFTQTRPQEGQPALGRCP